jgi:thiol-disulfide isomerase/thioredoxin
MRKNQPIVGKIYANWCGHCQSLKPEWDKMKLNPRTRRIMFVEIEESQTEKMAEFKQKYPQLQVNGYPTIFKIGANNRIDYYSGARTAEEIGRWALQKTANTRKGSFRRKGGMKKTVKRRKLFGLF